MTREKIISARIKNLIHTASIILSMAALLGWIGWLIAGGTGLIAAIFAVTISFTFTPKLPAASIMRLNRAKPVAPHALPTLFNILRTLSRKARLPRIPALYYIPGRSLNAFAAGTREDPAICISQGLLETLDTHEMAGILGHEITHIRNNDMQFMTLTLMFTRLTHSLSFFGLVFGIFLIPARLMGVTDIPIHAFIWMALAPSLSMLLQFSLSRAREFEADLGSSILLDSPKPLASALMKLEEIKNRHWHRFLFRAPVVQPPTWLSTHPHTRERIQRLLSLSSHGHMQTGMI